MMATLEVKQKIDGKWQLIPTPHVAGKTLREAINGWDGKEVVMKFEHEGKIVGMICGTPYWINRYREMGNVVFSFAEMLEMLSGSSSDSLDDLVLPEGVDEVFGGEFLKFDFPVD